MSSDDGVHADGTADPAKGKVVGMEKPVTFAAGELFTEGRPGNEVPGGTLEFGFDMAAALQRFRACDHKLAIL